MRDQVLALLERNPQRDHSIQELSLDLKMAPERVAGACQELALAGLITRTTDGYIINNDSPDEFTDAEIGTESEPGPVSTHHEQDDFYASK